MRPQSSWHTARLAVALVLALFMLVGWKGCDSANPIGGILDGLTADVNSVIEKAGADAQFTTLAAAGSVQDAIGQVESAYATQLNTSLDNLDATSKANIQRLQALVSDLQTNTAETIASANAGAQQLINTIPFTNKNPQVTSYGPLFVTPSTGRAVQISVHGNFVYAFQKNQTPTLSVAGVTYQPDLNTTQELGFSVPASAFPAATSAPAPISLQLTAPYEKGKVFKEIVPGVFRLLVASLPASPVTSATLTRQVTTTGTATQARRAPAVGTWDENSYDCNEHTATQTIAATPGWTIVPSSAQYVYDWNKNPNAATVELATSQHNIVVKYTTRPACFVGICNGCGRISIHVDYQEQQSVTNTTIETVPLQLRWGDVVVQPVPRNGWKLSLTLFDGRAFDVTASDHSNKYVLVDDLSTNVRVQVRTPEELVG